MNWSMKHKNKRKYIWIAAVLCWMLVIFRFSAQPAEESGEISGSLTYQMAEFVNHAFHLDWEEQILLQYAEEWEYPVRKIAHMTEYAVLAVLLLGNWMQYPALAGKRYLLAEAGAVFYAATDEFHQLFVKGRSGQITDVCIDGIGALIGLIFAFVLFHIIKNIKRKR